MILSTTARYHVPYHTLEVAREMKLRCAYLLLFFRPLCLLFSTSTRTKLRRALRKIICLSSIHTYLLFFLCSCVVIVCTIYVYLQEQLLTPLISVTVNVDVIPSTLVSSAFFTVSICSQSLLHIAPASASSPVLLYYPYEYSTLTHVDAR